MTKPQLAALLLAAAWAPAARADQCAWINRATAERAAGLVHAGDAILEYCEPCGDKPHLVPVTKVEAGAVPDETSSFELRINGQEEDIAYVYIRGRGDAWENLGVKTECGAARVSPQVHWTAARGLAPTADWSGTYLKTAGNVRLELEAMSGADLSVAVTVDGSGAGQRLELTSVAQKQDNEAKMDTALPGCAFTLRLDERQKRITVSESGSACGALGPAVAGTYAAKAE